jgi:hypothetical protein
LTQNEEDKQNDDAKPIKKEEKSPSKEKKKVKKIIGDIHLKQKHLK